MGYFDKLMASKNQNSRTNLLQTVVLLLVAGCAGNQGGEVVYPGNTTPEQQAVVSGEEVAPPLSASYLRQRVLADMLYEAKLAFEDNRLMSPPGNNAYDIYLQVLEVDEGNAVAVAGIRDIALRYIELSDDAIARHQYDEAESFLRRSTQLMPDTEALVQARSRLSKARENRITTFALDPNELRLRNEEVVAKLGDIAREILDMEAVFMINARTDEEGRWIYQTMRDAVNGFRLRGNINISGSPSVMVTIPQNSGV
jgi:hypothetical protein